MNKPRAIVTGDEYEDAEPTTRPLLASGNRLRVSAAPSADVEAAPWPERRQPAASEARLAAHSSSANAARQSSIDPNAPIRVASESTRLGPYQLVCELASGGMATVYLALYRSVEGFEKLCAVKRIHPHLAGDRAFTNMFADEAQIAARISHPYVCSVFSFGRSQQSHYIAMEFLRGEPLSAVMRRVARTPELGDDPRFPAIAARLVANFAEGLHAAHTLRDNRGALLEVVHRDVTPQNLFVLYDGTVRVTDFGIAQARRRLHQTEGQKLKGKLSYVAPEQLQGGKPDLRVDLWGLGVTLWELLAGRRLFLGSSEGETLSAVLSRPVPPPSSFRASVPAELDRIVLRALERDVQRRYKSARDLARDLERFLNTIGDQVPNMDVADWLATVFPQGLERLQALSDLAERVSGATADDTVVRVPSAPPAAPSNGSFVMPLASDIARERVSTLPPTREYPALRASKKAASEQSLTADARANLGESRPPALPATSKPRLKLVEHTSERPLPPVTPEVSPQARPPAAPPLAQPDTDRSLKVAIALSALLLATGVSSLVIRARSGTVGEAPGADATRPAAVAHAKLEPPPPAVKAETTAAPLERDVAPTTQASAELAPAAAKAERAGASAGVQVSAPVLTASKPAPAPPAKSPIASTTPTSQPATPAPTTGIVLVTTPGLSGDVFENGNRLGSTPGSFSLSIGPHDLAVRAASGVAQTVHVEIKPNAPTLVTVRLASQ